MIERRQFRIFFDAVSCIGGREQTFRQVCAPPGNCEREVQQCQGLQRQRGVQGGERVIILRCQPRRKDGLQLTGRIHDHRHHIACERGERGLHQVIEQRNGLGRLRAMFGKRRALQYSEKGAAVLLAHLLRLTLDPAQAAIDQFGIAAARHLVLAGKIRLQGRERAIRLAVNRGQIAVDGIDIDTRRALARIEAVGHQHALGGGAAGCAVYRRHLGGAAVHVAPGAGVERAEQLVPMRALHAEHGFELPVDAGRAGCRRRQMEQRLHLDGERPGVALVRGEALAAGVGKRCRRWLIALRSERLGERGFTVLVECEAAFRRVQAGQRDDVGLAAPAMEEALHLRRFMRQFLPPCAGATRKQHEADRARCVLGGGENSGGSPRYLILASLGIVEDEEQALVAAMLEKLLQRLPALFDDGGVEADGAVEEPGHPPLGAQPGGDFDQEPRFA